MKRLLTYLLLCSICLVSCQQDPDFGAEIYLVIENEQLTPSYTSVEVECQFFTNATIKEVYAQYALSEDFEDYREAKLVEIGKKYINTIEGLLDNTTYYIRYFVRNNYSSVTTEYSSTKTLKQLLAEVQTTPASNITYTSATVSGKVISDGGAEVTERGVVYSTRPNPNISSNKIAVGKGKGEFTTTLSKLNDGSTYYVRAYAVNTKGTNYGEQISFTTKKYVAPSITTAAVSNIAYTSATVGGNVTNDGGAEVTERGVVYSTSQNPTTTNTKKVSGKGLGSFSITLNSLSDGVTYYVRAYAINKFGTSYGEQVSFTTTQKTPPTITTTSVSNITSNSATIGGNVTNEGGAEVTEFGIVYSTSPNPTTSSNKKASGSGLRSFSVTLYNLSNGTTYYVRAYAINSEGTSYGEQKSFTTRLHSTPYVTTTSISEITHSSATVEGEVTGDGGAEVTERGVVYNTSSNPTTANTKKVSGKGVGSFSVVLSNLSKGVTYYVRAYAINNEGTSYGEERAFTTNKYTPPSVTTVSVSNISYTSATVGGKVTSDGGTTVTERGICYSTYSYPTIDSSTSSTIIKSGSGTGSYTIELNSLSQGIKYYVRAYAINSQGISYGEQKSFTTLTRFENGFEFVDLGLSVKWATMNIGANTPYDYGDYFAWGETTPKDTYDWSTYKLGNNRYDLTKYDTYFWGDGLTTLERKDDAAYVNWEGNWRMPDDTEFTELKEKCNWVWTGTGYQITGPNGNSIYIPAAGYKRNDKITDVGSYGYYWSRSLYTPFPERAWLLSFRSDHKYTTETERTKGFSIRPVCP